MIKTKQDGIHAAREAVSSYRQQARDLAAECEEARHAIEKVRAQLEETLLQLATGLLPDAGRETVAYVAEETGALHLTASLVNLQRQLEESQQRCAEIEADEEYRQRELLTHPTTGEYSLKVKEAAESVDLFNDLVGRFAFKEFQWLYKRGHHRPSEAGAFGRFWRAVTLADKREAKAEAAVLERIDEPTFGSCAEKYEQYQEQLAGAEAERDRWETKRQAVLGLVDELARLGDWVGNFDRESVGALRTELAAHFEEADFEELHANVRRAARVLTAKCHALAKKIAYLEDTVSYLQKEIEDRQKRVESIRNVQSKWQRNPYGLLRGDKTKWLVTVPEMKRAGTAKRVRWTRTVHHNIYTYDTYGDYSLFLAHAAAGAGAFLAYDAFAYRAAERMPYEGFTRGVITELDDYRDINGMDGPDYGGFQQALADAPEDYDPSGEGWEEGWEAGDEGDEAWDGDGDEDGAAGALADEAEGGDDLGGDDS